MNNLSFGGWDTLRNRPFAYYETIAGGMGASPRGPGRSAIHTHMTNSWNTPIEAFEHEYPVRVRAYGIRERIGRGGEACGRRRDRARAGISGGRRRDDSFRSAEARALWIAGRRERGLRQWRRDGWRSLHGVAVEDACHDSPKRAAANPNSGRGWLGNSQLASLTKEPSSPLWRS